MPRIKEADELFTIGAEDFLEALMLGNLDELSGGREIIVRGSVDLRRHPLRHVITEIPDAGITGDLAADETCALKVCKARVRGSVMLDGSDIEDFSPEPDLAGGVEWGVTGTVSAKRCARLRRIAGVFNNDVSLDGSGIQAIGADFRCEGELSVEACPKLRLLDCTATTVIADGSSLEATGPNAAIENFTAEGCARLGEATPIHGLRWAKYDGSGITSVHPQFLCQGPAYFKRCRKLASLSGSVRKIEVSMAPLERISGLKTGEAIFTDCKKLPSHFGGFSSATLVFARCALEELPAGIPQDTHVRIGACPNFSRLPSHWRGDISLTQLPSLTETPPGFRCRGKFDAEDCKNLRLLAGTVDGGVRLLTGLPRLQHLGRDLEVGGDLWVSPNAGVLSIGCRVRGSVVARAGTLRETSPELEVEGDGDFHGSRELRMLRGRFGGKVILDESAAMSLGADLEVGGDLHLRETPRLVSLNCTVGGHVMVVDSSLKGTGPAFRCGKAFNARNCPNFDTLQGKVGGKTRIRRKKTADKDQKPEEKAATQRRPNLSQAAKAAENPVYRTEAFAPGRLP